MESSRGGFGTVRRVRGWGSLSSAARVGISLAALASLSLASSVHARCSLGTSHVAVHEFSPQATPAAVHELSPQAPAPTQPVVGALETAGEDPWVRYEGGEGPGRGKHVVLVSGDEEYRSEEALPMLAKILARHHGFRCTVLFAIDPADGTIDPTKGASLPGLAALEDADLLVLFTRFRCLPDEDMRHLVGYVESGKPLIAIRTATHAFAYPAESKSPYARWSWDSRGWPGGFGKQVLGETWVAHHGAHGKQSTRGVIPEPAREHPILRAVRDVWGPTDVYTVGALPADARVLLEGAVLEDMTPGAKPVDGPLNAPRMPIAWTRERPLEGGGAQRVFTSTIGAASDLVSEDLRRLFVNASYWCVGLEEKIPARANVECVGEYDPTAFGFGTHRKGVRPKDHAWR